MSRWAQLRQTWDRLTLYFPLIAMLVLALGSWWLVRSMPELVSNPQDQPARTEPDYKLQNFTVKTFDANGLLTQQVGGQAATHFPASNTLHIQGIRIRLRNEIGSILTAQADQGVSSDNNETLTLTGGVQAVRQTAPHEPATRLRGEQLMVYTQEERLLSTLPIEMTRDRDLVSAQTLDFNSATGEYQLKGRVRAVLAPAPSNRPNRP